MIPDLDIYRSANVLVKQHGQDAPIEAAMRADGAMPKIKPSSASSEDAANSGTLLPMI